MLSAPSDWVYFSEGGKHAIFAHYRLILRVEKNSLVSAALRTAPRDERLRGIKQHNERYELVHENNTASASTRFRTLIVAPSIGNCYIDTPRTLLLHASFCAELYRSATSSGDIPLSRLSSWQVNGGSANDVEQPRYYKGTLLQNHTRFKPLRLPSNVRQVVSPVTISVEIKPKAGYLTNSPLIRAAHRCKFYHSRYELQQELMQKGILKKGWCENKVHEIGVVSSENENGFKRSGYSPLDLFSGEIKRIKRALVELSKNMQNNFRVWCNGVKAFGEYDQLTFAEYNEILYQLFDVHNDGELNSDARTSILDIIIDAVGNILDREKLLDNLLSLQSLDVIDGDGAVLVYNRLKTFFKGSESEIKMCLEKCFMKLEKTMVSNISLGANSRREGLLSSSPYQMPTCTHLSELINEMHQYKAYLQDKRHANVTVDESIANKYYISCNRHVEHLSKESCIFLLSNWLLSLTMCDVSFFVTFDILPFKEDGGMSKGELKERNLSTDSNGLFICQWDNSNLPNAIVRYNVKIIDCDPKPISKLHRRQDVEELFRFCEYNTPSK